jgi:hypothetical protein
VPAIVASPIRMRTPLPSKTHGPASLRGVIGPSCPFNRAGFIEVGDGVLVSLRPVVAAEEARAVGIGMGLDVALAESWLSVEKTGRPFGVWRVVVEGVDSRLLAGVSDSSSIMVTSIASGPCCAGTEGVGGTTGTRTLRTLLADSLDFRGGAIVCDWAPGPGAAPPLPLGFNEAPSCSLASSSEASCSHSSGSSTSASRSAAARQFGQMKIGYEGEDSNDLMHL